jgi:hypothetical protein
MSAGVTIGNRYVYVGTSAERVAFAPPTVNVIWFEQDTALWFTYSHTTKTWIAYAEPVELFGIGPTGGPIGSDAGNLFVLPWLWQPSSLSYVRASADANGNLLVATGRSQVQTAIGVAPTGTTTILNPPGGKAIQLTYYMLNGSENNVVNTRAILQFQSGTPQLTGPGLAPTGTLARNIGAGQRDVTGAVGDPLVIINTVGSVNWALEYDFV